MLLADHFFSSSSGSPLYLASSQQHLLPVTLFAPGHPPGVTAAPVTEPPAAQGLPQPHGRLGTAPVQLATVRSPQHLLGAAVLEGAQMSVNGCSTLWVPPDLGSRGR